MNSSLPTAEKVNDRTPDLINDDSLDQLIYLRDNSQSVEHPALPADFKRFGGMPFSVSSCPGFSRIHRGKGQWNIEFGSELSYKLTTDGAKGYFLTSEGPNNQPIFIEGEEKDDVMTAVDAALGNPQQEIARESSFRHLAQFVLRPLHNS